MVVGFGLAPMMLCAMLLAEAASQEKLPPPTRAAVMMALLGIALLGMLLVVIILLGGHWVRRQGRYRRAPAVPPDRRPILSGEAAESSTMSQANGDDPTSTADTIISHMTRRNEKEPP